MLCGAAEQRLNGEKKKNPAEKKNSLDALFSSSASKHAFLPVSVLSARASREARKRVVDSRRRRGRGVGSKAKNEGSKKTEKTDGRRGVGRTAREKGS